jgi:hypothetical protein
MLVTATTYFVPVSGRRAPIAASSTVAGGDMLRGSHLVLAGRYMR